VRRRALQCLVILCIALAKTGARADAAPPTPDAEALVTRGIELREQGKDDQALELFRRADAIAPSPRTRAQVALAEQALGIWVAAEVHLEAALAAKDDPWIERYRVALASALETVRQHVGRLEVRGGVQGAEVFVDGAKIGALPMTGSWRVEVGRRSLELRAPGHHAASRVTEIAPGATTRETIELVPEITSERPAGGPNDKPRTSVIVETPKGSGERTLGWVFAGTGAALVATGIVGVVARQLAVSAYNEDKTCPGMGQPTQPSACQDRISAAETWRTILLVSFISGGAVGLGGVVLLLTASPAKPAAPGATVACGPAALGVSCVGRF